MTKFAGSWGAKMVAVIKHLRHKVFLSSLSLKGWATKAKETPFLYEVRLAPLDTNPEFFVILDEVYENVKQRSVSPCELVITNFMH